MELDSSMMQPKVVLDHCDIAKYIKEEKIDYKPRFKRKSVADNFNPWNVPNLEQFLVYSCPECDIEFKHNTRDTFIAHANDKHPKSRPFMFLFNLKQENFMENDNMDDDIENSYEDDFADQSVNFGNIETEEITSEWDLSFEPPSKQAKFEEHF